MCAVLPVGLHARVAFAALWIAGQAGLILSAARQPDHIFGFRMFPEASTLEIRLAREVAGLVVPAPRGEWKATDSAGAAHAFTWCDRVRDSVLATLDARVFASYGVDAQLARLQRALDDVADHVPDDAETTRLRAEVIVRKNGGDPVTVTLVSHARRAQ
ncbi:MAG: hypothetical protein M3O36_08150 [Myxococcota bacterium]|nr:hypothetical protein [Myxococcota bacterium]